MIIILSGGQTLNKILVFIHFFNLNISEIFICKPRIKNLININNMNLFYNCLSES